MKRRNPRKIWVVNVAEFAPEQITTPQTVLHMVEKRQPRWAGIRVRPVVKAQDSANYVLIDLDAKSQCNLLGDPRTASCGYWRS
jgi:hypothetical protein